MHPLPRPHLGPHGLSDRRRVSLHRRHDLVRRGRRLQLPLHACRGHKLAVRSLAALEKLLRARKGPIKIITGHTGWTDDLDAAFSHRTELCRPFTRRYTDPDAPYDGYEEADDTEEKARTLRLEKKVFRA